MLDTEETVDAVEEPTESQEEVTEPQNEVEESFDEELNEQEFSDDADGDNGNSDESDVETTKPQDETKAKKQTKAENAEFARKRREQEAILKKREDDAYKKGQLELMIGEINKFTGEKIEDEDDLNEYLLMKEAEKAGYDPATELPKYQKQKAKDERKQREIKSFDVEEDKRLFRETYPDVEISDLIKDKDFASFAEPFAQKVPLQVIYQQYNMMKSSIEETARAKAEEKYKRKLASPGSLVNTSQEKPLTIADMSDEEFERIHEMAVRGDLRKS